MFMSNTFMHLNFVEYPSEESSILAESCILNGTYQHQFSALSARNQKDAEFHQTT